jgi:hypothetical protein
LGKVGTPLPARDYNLKKMFIKKRSGPILAWLGPVRLKKNGPDRLPTLENIDYGYQIKCILWVDYCFGKNYTNKINSEEINVDYGKFTMESALSSHSLSLSSFCDFRCIHFSAIACMYLEVLLLLLF